MRIAPLVLAAVLVAPLAFAKDKDGGSDRKAGEASDEAKVDCTVDAQGNDRVAKGRDVVIEAGERVDDAVAVDGNVVIRAGARVKNALALHGSVTVESGASVEASVIAIGGKATVAKDAKVKGSTLSLDKREGLHVRGEDGKDLNFSVSIDGTDLAGALLKPILAGVHRCKVIESPRH